MLCVSCKTDLSIREGSTSFKCPKCGENIGRCGNCRKRGVKYVCPSCGFEGP
ncbi:MAG: zinc finger domain-containing protein [Candidatus Rehaiarchaeum fermentans]|nr:zinc finger domain-containing protein [Candidatus Rehaiarchaeum fermentans]